MNSFFKIVGFVLAALFMWAAALQYNDSDAFRWYVLYGAAALASILFALRALKFIWALLLFGFYLVVGINNWPAQFEGVTIGEGDFVNIEKGREALGMILSAVIMLFYALVIRRRPKW